MSEPPLASFTPLLHTKRLRMRLVNLDDDDQELAEIMNAYLRSVDGFEWTVEGTKRLLTNLTLSPSNCLGQNAPGPAVN